MHDDKTLQWFDKMGVARPSHDPHGSPDEIRANLKTAKVSKWWMEGNELHAESDLGPFVQSLPTDIICKGTDENGLPILVKLSL